MISRPVASPLDYITSDGTCLKTHGWRSNLALGVMYGLNGFASVMLLSGRVIADNFPTLRAAHAFNELLVEEKKLVVGSYSVEELFRRIGGEAEAKALVDKIKAKVMKEKTA